MDRYIGGLLAIFLAASACGAPADTASGVTGTKASGVQCEVRGGERLERRGSGGAEALCQAIRDALANAKVAGRVSAVNVVVPSSSALEAVVVLKDGKRSDPLTLEVSDGQITSVTFKQLGRDIADMVARSDE